MAAVEAGELPIGGRETLEPDESRLEDVFLKLRTLRGISESEIAAGEAAPLLEAGLLVDDRGRLVPTDRGMLLLNEVVLGLTRKP